jgi:transcriptional regulator with GAF, ATPase, and Fis domain/tetratricopeptide (TPR) repeat protein
MVLEVPGENLPQNPACPEPCLSAAREAHAAGDFVRCLSLLEGLLPEAPAGPSVLRGQALSLAAQAQLELGHYDLARRNCEEALSILRGTGENEEVATLEWSLGRLELYRGDLRAAHQHVQDSLSTYRRLQRSKEVARAHNLLAHISFLTRNWSLALEHLQSALDLSRAEGDERTVGVIMRNLGTVYLRTGDWSLSREHLTESLITFERLNQPLLICQACLSLGLLDMLSYRLEKARPWLERALELGESHGFRREAALAVVYLGELEVLNQRWDEGRALLSRALTLAEALPPTGDIAAQVYRSLGELSAGSGDGEKAEELAGRSLKIAEEMGDELERAQALRVLALAAEQRRDVRTALGRLEEACSLLEGLGEKFERGRTLLEFSRVLVEAQEKPSLWGGRSAPGSGMEDFLGRAMPAIDQARGLFRSLNCHYWWGRTELLDAALALQRHDLKRAKRALASAGALFQECGDPGGLEEVRRIHSRLAGSLVREVLSGRYEEGLLERMMEKAVGGKDNSQDWKGLLRLLCQVVDGKRALLASTEPPGRILASLNLDDREASSILDVVEDLQERRSLTPRTPFISLDASLDERFATLSPAACQVLRRGGTLTIVPFGLDGSMDGVIYVDRARGEAFDVEDLRLLLRLARITAHLFVRAQQVELKRENLDLRSQFQAGNSTCSVVTQSHAMLEILKTARKLADASIAVLIEGETGTGKEQLARAIHHGGIQRTGRFVAVNCAAVPDALLESELFGHRKGAFTGADSDRQGLIAAADKGTFLLDEVGDLPPATQLKLLRVLEQGEVLPLGETRPRRVDVRFISASNRDLKAAVEAGRFRLDLYYRLEAVRIKLPPLRDRKEDIPLLAEHFLSQCRAECGKRVRGIAPEVLRVFVDYDWPGNIRELQNQIRRLVVLGEEDAWLGPELLSEDLMVAYEDHMGQRLVTGRGRVRSGGYLREAVNRLDRRMIEQALVESRGNKTWAARALGLSRQGLLKKMERLGLLGTSL